MTYLNWVSARLSGLNAGLILSQPASDPIGEWVPLHTKKKPRVTFKPKLLFRGDTLNLQRGSTVK